MASTISGVPDTNVWWKYIGRSTTSPLGADVVTCMETPRLNGSDTARPMPAESPASNTLTVRRLPASMTAWRVSVVPSVRKYVMSAVAAWKKSGLPSVR